MKAGSRLLLMFCFMFIIPASLCAESFRGRVVNVLSGDTIEVERDVRTQVVRLDQIRAPISGQPYGRDARIFVSRIVDGETVTIKSDNYDFQGRMVGEVFLPDGTSLNKLVVVTGYAWQYDGFSKDPVYSSLEALAREKRSGLWREDNPVPPWEWARIQRHAVLSTNGDNPTSDSFNCGSKQSCAEMSSCLEAKFYLHACGLTRLDRDGDGIPCEAKCQ